MEKRKLSELSLPELESLYRVLDEGLSGEPCTKRIEAEAGDGEAGRVLWANRLKYRQRELQNIKNAIHDKVHEIEYEVYDNN